MCQKYHCGLDFRESMSDGVKESDLKEEMYVLFYMHLVYLYAHVL